VFSKIASPTTLCIDEREKWERVAISYFFQFHSNSCLSERRRKKYMSFCSAAGAGRSKRWREEKD
jgi:hypothetical protein